MPSKVWKKKLLTETKQKFTMVEAWIEVVSDLTSTFGVADAKYSVQHEVTDGTVYVASGLTSAYDSGVST